MKSIFLLSLGFLLTCSVTAMPVPDAPDYSDPVATCVTFDMEAPATIEVTPEVIYSFVLNVSENSIHESTSTGNVCFTLPGELLPDKSMDSSSRAEVLTAKSITIPWKKIKRNWCSHYTGDLSNSHFANYSDHYRLC